MNEQARLQELREYKVLDTLPEKELDELAEIASAICDTPISLVSFIEDTRQWSKAKKGIDVNEAPRQYAFCQHALQNPQEVLVIDDPLNDERFKSNPLVIDKPHIRFYAGAPLATPRGNVLGTICIMDDKPRRISETQKKALQLLAKRVMHYLEARKRILEQEDKIKGNATRLRKLSDQAPGAIYQLEMRPDGKISFPFLSKGITVILPGLDPAELKENARLAFRVIHPDDLEAVKLSLQDSYAHLTNWSIEYRVLGEHGQAAWHWTSAKPEKKEDGTVIWYGTFQDITERKEYIKTLEQILFDISHVMRRPVANMLGLTAIIAEEDLDSESQREFIGYIRKASEEMDEYVKKLNGDYHQTMLKVTSQGAALPAEESK